MPERRQFGPGDSKGNARVATRYAAHTRLAHMTISDHRTAMAKLKAVAKADGVTLPAKPNAQQHAAAATELTAKRPALTYFELQVAGHEQSIAQTKYEIKRGSKANVVAYAKYYLPVAEMHLTMSKAYLKRLENS
ncbi:DUF4142 domain-containing protein [uncultured Jatrophihabitans sp.]|uniref:DUF4142 domain-containing protein n=1 Tax=uncultured Jatrophihabitans sp. TaxID=1610747 RepID=UPI0035CA5064